MILLQLSVTDQKNDRRNSKQIHIFDIDIDTIQPCDFRGIKDAGLGDGTMSDKCCYLGDMHGFTLSNACPVNTNLRFGHHDTDV